MKCTPGLAGPPLRLVILDLTVNPGQKVIMDTALHQRVPASARCENGNGSRLIGHRRKEIETAKQHGI